ncbi:MAG: ceramidase domain-containing protein [SAR86 cluster bacterium]|jgi:predicted membrane channel-forming protein YqfA (hemolysin III family)|nr:ceramidase domain-containing protein [SAR86 cluster bacterium]
MTSNWENKVFPIALLLSFGFMAVYVTLGFLGVIPSLEPGAVIGEAWRWCERVSSSMFREPVNALSNLGFMIAGLSMYWVLSREERDSRNQFTGLTPISMLYAGAVIYLGPGSMLMHGTHTDWGQWADNLSMVMYILIPWLINVGEMGRWSVKKTFTVYLFIVIIDGIFRWTDGLGTGFGFNLFSVSIGLWFISECLYRYWTPNFRWLSGFIGFLVCAVFGIFPWEIWNNLADYWWIATFWIPGLLAKEPPRYSRTYNPWFFAGMFTYLLAFSIWLTGVPDSPYCDPDRFFQAHGIWHVLSALATWCFFKFLRTEKLKD